MFVKAIGTLLVLGFFYIQLGTSLECYNCDSLQSCISPSKVTCTPQIANDTTAHLQFYYRENLTNVTSPNYDCFHHNYTSVSNNVTYRGCVYRAIAPCDLNFKDEFKGLKRVDCYRCSGNLCNPAGTFSSSMMTMFASISVVAIYKVLKM